MKTRQAQSFYWAQQATQWRTRLEAQRTTLDAAFQRRGLWWGDFRARQVTHWQQRINQRGAVVSQFPELVGQWHPDNPVPSTVRAGALISPKWQCPLNASHVFTSVVKDRSQKGTGCPCCRQLGTVADASALLDQLADAADEFRTLGTHDVVSWVHHTWAVDPQTGHWRPVTHAFPAQVKSRFRQGDACLVCSGFVVDATNSLATWHPELVEELDPQLDPHTVPCTSRDLVDWTCPHGHNYPASTLNRCTGQTRCPWCTSSTPREQARLAAELNLLVGILPTHPPDPRLHAGQVDFGSYRLPLTTEQHTRYQRRRSYEEVDILLELDGRQVAVEYDGEAFHGAVHRPRRPEEIKKERVLRDCGVLLVRVREGSLDLVTEPGVVSVPTLTGTPARATAMAVLEACRSAWGLTWPLRACCRSSTSRR